MLYNKVRFFYTFLVIINIINTFFEIAGGFSALFILRTAE